MTTTNCPSCGAPVVFNYGTSIVVVCEHCSAVVARTDRGIENLGKVAALLDSGSPLHVGLDGRYDGQSFRVTGRVQLQHAMGGVWDEWYAAFADGRWGWLAEAQGRFYLTFGTRTPPDAPPIASLQAGQAVPGSLHEWVVDEIGEAAARSGEGEIPWRVVPGDRYDYADLSAPGGRFATLDYSEDHPLLFAGHQLTLDQLGISAKEAPRETHIRGASVNCPNCGGPLELRMPDAAERVTCPHCGSLLDINEGKLQFLQALKQQEITPLIPLGSKGRIEGIELTVVGFLRRRTFVDEIEYTWDEYLLYEPRAGFRWLIDSDDHWTYAHSVVAGDVGGTNAHAKSLTYGGKVFRIFQQGEAEVAFVLGEFYWKVAQHEVASTADYVAPPEMLSREVIESEGSQEVAFTHGRYMPVKEVEKTFNVSGLPRPSSVAPNQPNPYHLSIWRDFLIFVAVAIVLAIVLFATAERRVLVDKAFPLAPLNLNEQSKVFFTDPFTIKAHHNIAIEAQSNVDNSWINVDADLVNEKDSVTQQFSIPVEYYHGVDDGESWSEGGQEKDIYLRSLPAGSYTMRLDVQWDGPNPPSNALRVRVREGVPHLSHLLFALILLLFFPVIALVRYGSFESKRWNEAMFKRDGSANE